MVAPTASIYVQYGCGHSTGRSWINFDSSPTLRIERLPLIGPLLGALSGNAQSFPKAVRYGDIRKGLPVAAGTVRAAYASHVLEHLAYDDFRLALRNTYKMLAPGGIFRLIVPDLQARARLYLDGFARDSADAASQFMRSTHLGQEQRPRSALGRLRTVLGGSAHLWMWDEPSIRAHLTSAGFVDVRRCDFGNSGDPHFDEVEDKGRFVDDGLGIRELAMSARKPQAEAATERR